MKDKKKKRQKSNSKSEPSPTQPKVQEAAKPSAVPNGTAGKPPATNGTANSPPKSAPPPQSQSSPPKSSQPGPAVQVSLAKPPAVPMELGSDSEELPDLVDDDAPMEMASQRLPEATPEQQPAAKSPAVGKEEDKPEPKDKSGGVPPPLTDKQRERPASSPDDPETPAPPEAAEESLPAAPAKASGVVRETTFPSPFVWCLEPEMAAKFCNHCMRPPKPGKSLHRCSGCRFAHFCDGACQKAAWDGVPGHKAECARLKAAYPNAPTLNTLFFARLIDFLVHNQVNIAEELPTPPDGQRGWAQLMSHSAAIRTQPDRISGFFALRKDMQAFLGKPLPVSDSELWILYCKKIVNCHGVFTQDAEQIGKAMDFAGSFYDHSCRPNVSIVFDGKAMTFRSLDADVDVRDVSKAFVTYSEALWEGPRRREKLQKYYCFTCRCARCREDGDRELLFLRCQACGGDVAFFGTGHESAACQKCSARPSREDFARAQSLMAEVPDRCRKGFLDCEDKESVFAEEKELSALEEYIERAEEALAPRNLFLTDLYIKHFQLSITKGLHLREALTYAEKSTGTFRYVHHPKHKKLAFHLLRLLLLEIKTQRPFDAPQWRATAEEALGIFQTWYGDSHAFVERVKAFLGDLARAAVDHEGAKHLPPDTAQRLLKSLRFGGQ